MLGQLGITLCVVVHSEGVVLIRIACPNQLWKEHRGQGSQIGIAQLLQPGRRSSDSGVWVDPRIPTTILLMVLNYRTTIL